MTLRQFFALCSAVMTAKKCWPLTVLNYQIPAYQWKSLTFES